VTCREGACRRLQLDEISDGTFYPSQSGTTGIELYPHYQSPQVAILGVGMVQRRPIVVGDALAIACGLFSWSSITVLWTASSAHFLQESNACSKSPGLRALMSVSCNPTRRFLNACALLLDGEARVGVRESTPSWHSAGFSPYACCAVCAPCQ